MRAFIAIELPQEIKDFLGRIQNQLKTSGADVKWVNPENIHLTLKFLGEIDEKKMAKISEILNDIAENKNSFHIRISSLGAFPNMDFPRVIWVGIGQGDTETKAIAKELEQNLAQLGIPKEDKPFSCHITIGRTRSTLNREKLVRSLKSAQDSAGKENLTLSVTNLALFKSTLTPKGPIYEVLHNASLKTT